MRIGGSNVAGICGISPWSTPLDEFMKITGQVKIPDNPAMEWGRRLEPVVRQKYQEATGRHVFFNQNPNKYGVEFQHPILPFIVGSLDGISENHQESRVLEIKTARTRDAWLDGVPEYYACQVQHYMACTGLNMADVAVLFGASEFDIFEVARDDELISILLKIEVDFWNKHVVPMVPPDCTTPEDRNTRWPRSIQRAVEADGNTARLCSDLKAIKVEIAAIEANKAALESAIKDFLQDNDTLMVSGKPAVTWKQAKDSQGFDKDAFMKEHPDLYKNYLTTRTGSRRFLLK